MTLFKRIIDGEIPAKVVYEDDDVLAFLDISQGTPGHTLIIPKEETASLLTASPEVLTAVSIASQHVAKLLMEKLGASGVNILSNANAVAGQTVFHYHVHVIPRYDHDELTFTFKKHENDIDRIHQRITQ
ncbi:HIT family protein [Erysipelothrix sp. HDW6C]|uniref:HIT family protein n=1 Tax=Erysipelothrix sp. HDW6C TaxID=2714930 RepID=UPI001407E510|nr:HIT family protein [Erysipelothrix sp. HDW6C]QIK70432.1 HIT family protein [Erysipelothrix sp. HDW6C]